MILLLLAAILVSGAAAQDGVQNACVDNEHSRFVIHVGTGGMFGAFAHDHLVQAKQISGCAKIDRSRPEQSSVELTFPSKGVTVLDPDHAKDRPKVQEAMETQVLNVAKFPEIRFKSTQVRQRSPGVFLVTGDLTIRDRTRPASITLNLKQVDDKTVE